MSGVSGSGIRDAGVFARLSPADQVLALRDEAIHGNVFIVQEGDEPPRRIDPAHVHALSEVRLDPRLRISSTADQDGQEER